MTSFYPSRRAVFAIALGMPLAVLLALAAPGLWTAGLAWPLMVLGLMLADAFLAARPRQLSVAGDIPHQLGVGRAAAVAFRLNFPRHVPRVLEAELEGNERLGIAPTRQSLDGATEARFELIPLRRGLGRMERLWLRWTGPLGFTWVQRVHPLERNLPILPDIETVREEATRLFRRDAGGGLHLQLERGSGAEFHALRDFQPGHDPRQIDWKQSARHHALLVKEFRIEQNQHIVCALDCGRLMGEPLMGQPRLDRALRAILLLAYVGLKLGDRVGLFAFDSRPRLSSGTVAGAGGFAQLQRVAAGLDYSTEETNFTLGLTQLSGELSQRAVIVIFTDFADSTSAELMLENVANLLKRHSVLFVAFRDAELEAMREERPRDSEDVTRAVIADMIMKERDGVLGRLRQMGVDVLDAPVNQISAGLIQAYLAIKQRARMQP